MRKLAAPSDEAGEACPDGDVPIGARSGERRMNIAAAAAHEVGVFLLDGAGASTLPVRGWRGQSLFEGYWEATHEEIRAAVSLELECLLELHAQFEFEGRHWIVLRRSGRYSER